MIRSIRILVVLLVIVTGIFYLGQRIKSPTIDEQDKVFGQETAQFENKVSVEHSRNTYQAAWSGPFDGDSILLSANFEQKLKAREIFEIESCELLINGGFYSVANNPIGLFISEGKRISSWQANELLNGTFSINDFDTPRIMIGMPQDNLETAIQTGPVLLENTSVKKLSIKNDKQARRVVVATTGENKVVFIIIYDDNSFFQGPFLEDLPEILSIFQQETGIILADAVNLDGGSTSAFITQNYALTELNPIGSYFCIK